jgi:hypothetical protein
MDETEEKAPHGYGAFSFFYAGGKLRLATHFTMQGFVEFFNTIGFVA